MKLDQEQVFIYPTDTVWGIGASIYSLDARKKISDIKGSPEDKPLSIMFTDINILVNSFNLPEALNLQWLEDFYKMESTLGIPLSMSNIKIPSWVTGKSDIVSVRCLGTPALKNISEALNAPFFTTSLNRTGEPAIVNYKDAVSFQKTYASEVPLFGDESYIPSGRSSTIVFFRGNSFEVIRAGQKIEEIKKHLELTRYKTT
jgi:L-threonylcarbamoyladenylate synthase